MESILLTDTRWDSSWTLINSSFPISPVQKYSCGSSLSEILLTHEPGQSSISIGITHNSCTSHVGPMHNTRNAAPHSENSHTLHIRHLVPNYGDTVSQISDSKWSLFVLHFLRRSTLFFGLRIVNYSVRWDKDRICWCLVMYILYLHDLHFLTYENSRSSYRRSDFICSSTPDFWNYQQKRHLSRKTGKHHSSFKYNDSNWFIMKKLLHCYVEVVAFVMDKLGFNFNY